LADRAEEPPVVTPEQKKSNLRLALILATVAVALFVGFIVKSAYFGI
jgi:hypothetical protein